VIGLHYSARTITSLPTFLGLQFRTQTELGNDMKLTSWVRAAWKHEWETDRSTESSFLTAPGFNFVVDGAFPARDALRLSAGANLQLAHNLSVFAGFDGDFAGSGHGYAGSLGLQVKW
jgi:outer membrane autotransporter protein